MEIQNKKKLKAIENTCSVAECNSSCVSGYGGGQYSTVFTDPIHSRTNSTLPAKLYKAIKKTKVSRWSPDDPQMVPFRQPFSHARKAASARLCVGLQLKPIRQVLLRADFVLAYFRLFGFQKLFYMDKYTKLTFWLFFKIFKEFSRPYPGELLEGPGGHVTPPTPPPPPPG